MARIETSSEEKGMTISKDEYDKRNLNKIHLNDQYAYEERKLTQNYITDLTTFNKKIILTLCSGALTIIFTLLLEKEEVSSIYLFASACFFSSSLILIIFHNIILVFCLGEKFKELNQWSKNENEKYKRKDKFYKPILNKILWVIIYIFFTAGILSLLYSTFHNEIFKLIHIFA